MLVLAALPLLSCRSQADPPAPDAALSAPPAHDATPPLPLPLSAKATIYGEWERRSEPYRGMRMMLERGAPNALVTRASNVEPGAKNKAELECQRSLWKRGDVLLRDVSDDAATIVVRDWGLTQGVCRHRDTMASARISLSADDTLAIAVTRGKKTTTQEWSRVR